MVRFFTLICTLAFTVFWIDGTAVAAPSSKRVSASMIIDSDTGTVIHSENADTMTYPASLTKIMTLYMTFDALDRGKIDLNTRFTVSKHASKQAPSKLGLKAGDTIRVIDLIRAIAIKSANDAAVVMAEGLSGSEGKFAAAMTVKARQLGMRATTFRNASGLPNLSQKTTARDMAILGRAIIRDHPKYYPYFSETSFSYAGQYIAGHNNVVARYEGADGLKTGYINASGFNLVSSAKRGNKRLIGVVMGGGSAAARDNKMMDLLDAGFTFVQTGQRSDILALNANTPPLREAPRVAEKAAPAPVQPQQRMTAARQPQKPAPKALPARGKPQTPPAATSATKQENGWGIQVGAFNGKAPAQTALSEVTKSLGGIVSSGKGTIVSFRSGKSTVYRARVMGISEAQARSACKKLTADKKSCHVISPAA